MAKGCGRLNSGVRREKEKEALLHITKKMKNALETNTLLRAAVKESNQLLKYLMMEQRNLTAKLNSSCPWQQDSKLEKGLQDSSLAMADGGSNSSSKRVEDSGHGKGKQGIVSEEELKFTKMAISIVQGYNANKGKEKYKFHKIVTVISKYEYPRWNYSLTFEVENLGAPVGSQAGTRRICRAEIADYGPGEAYVESCTVMKKPLFVKIVNL